MQGRAYVAAQMLLFLFTLVPSRMLAFLGPCPSMALALLFLPSPTIWGRWPPFLFNCLLSQGGLFNLLSVSQLQASNLHSVDFALEFPHLSLHSSSGFFRVLLRMTDGLCSVNMEPLSLNDDRYCRNPRFDLTEPGRYVPPSSVVPAGSLLRTLDNWTCRKFVAPSPRRRVLAFPAADGQAFGAELKDFCQQFIVPLSPPPARRTYDTHNTLHMSDLSVRFMSNSNDKLQRTVQLNRGLAPASGRVPPLNFPQGKFRQGKTPRVSKDKIHHLHHASICEVVFTDTFETGDHRYKYSQAFVDYRSRWGDIIPLKSCTQIGW